MPKYTVPRELRAIAKKAIDYNLSLPISKRAAYKDENNKRVPGTGMRTARRLASGSVDEQQLILMRAWFARHGESEKEKRHVETVQAKQQLHGLFGVAQRLAHGSMVCSEILSENAREMRSKCIDNLLSIV